MTTIAPPSPFLAPSVTAPTPEQLANRETWRAALLSGDYKQGTNSLRSLDPETGEYRFCCLGVALDALGDGDWRSERSFVYVDADGRESNGDVSESLFSRLFGFSEDESHVGPFDDPNDIQGFFIKANDVLKYTFNQIAALIPTQEGT